MNRDRALKTVIERKGIETPSAGMSFLIMQRIATQRQRKARLYERISYLWASLGAIAMIVISVTIFMWNSEKTTLPDYSFLTPIIDTTKTEWSTATHFDFSIHIPIWGYISLFIGGISLLLLLIDYRMRRYYAQRHKERHCA